MKMYTFLIYNGMIYTEHYSIIKIEYVLHVHPYTHIQFTLFMFGVYTK